MLTATVKEFESDATTSANNCPPSLLLGEWWRGCKSATEGHMNGTNKSICSVTPWGCLPAPGPGRLSKGEWIWKIIEVWPEKEAQIKFTEEATETQLEDKKINVVKKVLKTTKKMRLFKKKKIHLNRYTLLFGKTNQQVSCENSYNKLKNLWNHNVLWLSIWSHDGLNTVKMR